MTFEPVLIPALLGTHLAVELELLKALGLHLVGKVLGAAPFGLRHGCFFLVQGGEGRSTAIPVGGRG